MEKRRDEQTTSLSEPKQELTAETRVLDRAARQRKLGRLKIAVAITGLTGTGLFSGLAVANTHASSSHRVTPDRQVSNLENAQGSSFFASSGGTFAPPSASSGPPQTTSGGS